MSIKNVRERLLVLGLAALIVGCGGDNLQLGSAASINPLATADQVNSERQAAAIMESAAVKQATEDLKAQWIATATRIGGVPAESLKDLDQAISELAMSNAIMLTNGDPYQPKIISNLAAPHSWFGIQVPGSRTILDNPDTIYRRIPLDPTASYVIRGKRHAQRPVDFNFTLWDTGTTTIANIANDELKTEVDGSFVITLNAGAATGAGNHFQLPPNAGTLFIRDTVNAWGAQQFNTLSVERLSGGSGKASPTTDQLVAATAAGVRNGNGAFAYYSQLAYAQAVNTLPALSYGGTAGRLSTQIATYSTFKIADDEALVVNVTLGGATYFIAPVYTRWMTTTDYINHTQTLNNAQAVANPDGSYTFVIAPEDPDVYNWIDTVGMHEGILNLRWQGMPAAMAAVPASATARLVKLADLRSTLPSTTRYVGVAERQAQLSARAASYAPRYTP